MNYFSETEIREIVAQVVARPCLSGAAEKGQEIPVEISAAMCISPGRPWTCFLEKDRS